MRFKLPRLFCPLADLSRPSGAAQLAPALIAIFSGISAHAYIVVQPASPYNWVGGTGTILGNLYYAAAPQPQASPTPVAVMSSYSNLDLTNEANSVIYFTITENALTPSTAVTGDTAATIAAVAAPGAPASGAEANVPIYSYQINGVNATSLNTCSSDSACGASVQSGSNTFKLTVSYPLNGGSPTPSLDGTTTVTVGISIHDLCVYAGSTLTTFCNGSTGPNQPTGTTSYNFGIQFFIIPYSNPNGGGAGVANTATQTQLLTSAAGADTSGTGTVFFEGGGNPTVSSKCPNSIAGFYYPGDGQIIANPSIFAGSWATSASPMYELLVVGADGATPRIDSSYANNSIYSTPSLSESNFNIGGFTNTSNGSDHKYTLAFGAVDLAGAYAFSTSASSTTTPGCELTPVQSATIQTFLKSNKCFIATAAFRAQDLGPLPLLRSFRDRVLLPTTVGTRLVDWYYAWSPAAADWLLEHPGARVPVLFLLLPVEALAWFALHGMIAVMLLTVALLLIGYAVASSMDRKGLA